MTNKKPEPDMNDSSDTSYRGEDALRFEKAEAGFGDRRNGLGYADVEGTLTGYSPAQKAPTYSWPDKKG